MNRQQLGWAGLSLLMGAMGCASNTHVANAEAASLPEEDRPTVGARLDLFHYLKPCPGYTENARRVSEGDIKVVVFLGAEDEERDLLQDVEDSAEVEVVFHHEDRLPSSFRLPRLDEWGGTEGWLRMPERFTHVSLSVRNAALNWSSDALKTLTLERTPADVRFEDLSSADQHPLRGMNWMQSTDDLSSLRMESPSHRISLSLDELEVAGERLRAEFNQVDEDPQWFQISADYLIGDQRETNATYSARTVAYYETVACVEVPRLERLASNDVMSAL